MREDQVRARHLYEDHGHALRPFSSALHTTLCHVPDPGVALREGVRVLRPGGKLVVFEGDCGTATLATKAADPRNARAEAFREPLVHDPWPVNHLRVADTWERGDPYERYVGRWSRLVAPPFLSWLAVPAGRTWVDVGCGTGALCAAILDHAMPSMVVGIEPSQGFLETARTNLAGRALLHLGSATAIPLSDALADVIVSALVLNFVPDPSAALAEMARVAGPEGTIGAYVWDYAGNMQLMRIFWDAAAALDPEAARLDEGVRFPLCRPEALTALFLSARLGAIEVAAIDVATNFASFDDYWQPFLGGQGPAPAYVTSLAEAARARLRDRLRERLPVRADGSIALVARAWAIRAVVAR